MRKQGEAILKHQIKNKPRLQAQANDLVMDMEEERPCCIVWLDQKDINKCEEWTDMPLCFFVVDKMAVIVTQKIAIKICDKSGHEWNRVDGVGDSIESLLRDIVPTSQDGLRDKDPCDDVKKGAAIQLLEKITRCISVIGINEMNGNNLRDVLSEIRGTFSHKEFKSLDFSEHRELINIITQHAANAANAANADDASNAGDGYNRQEVSDDDIREIVKAYIVALVYTVIFHNRIKIKKLIDIAQKWSLFDDPMTHGALVENNRVRDEIVYPGGKDNSSLSPEQRKEFYDRYQYLIDNEAESCFRFQSSKKSDFKKLIVTHQDILHVFKHYNRLWESCRDQEGKLETQRIQLEERDAEINRLNEGAEPAELRREQEDRFVRLRTELQEKAAENSGWNHERESLRELYKGQGDENKRLLSQLQEKDVEIDRLSRKVNDQRQKIWDKTKRQTDMENSAEAAAQEQKERTKNIRDQLKGALRSGTNEEKENLIKSGLIVLDEIDDKSDNAVQAAKGEVAGN